VQLKRIAKHGAEYCLVVVNEAKDSGESLPAPQLNPNLLTPEKLNKVVADYPDVFPDQAPHGGSKIQCNIEVIHVTSKKRVNRPMFRYCPLEMAEIEKQVAHLLEQGYISPSISPYDAPVLFVKKPRSTELRMCEDWRAVNANTVKNAGPLPRIEDLLSVLANAKVFSSFDLRQAYHQVNLLPSDRPKTAFKTPLGLYEYRCLAFGLTNAPAVFQSVMNRIFRPYLNQFVAEYLDDILVFSKDATEHEQHIRLVLDGVQKQLESWLDQQIHLQLIRCVQGTAGDPD